MERPQPAEGRLAQGGLAQGWLIRGGLARGGLAQGGAGLSAPAADRVTGRLLATIAGWIRYMSTAGVTFGPDGCCWSPPTTNAVVPRPTTTNVKIPAAR